MEKTSLEVKVLENGITLKEISVSLEKYEGGIMCQPSIRIKDVQSGLEGSIKLPDGDYSSLREFMETIARGKLDGAFVLSIVRKISSLFEIRRTT